MYKGESLEMKGSVTNLGFVACCWDYVSLSYSRPTCFVPFLSFGTRARDLRKLGLCRPENRIEDLMDLNFPADAR